MKEKKKRDENFWEQVPLGWVLENSAHRFLWTVTVIIDKSSDAAC